MLSYRPHGGHTDQLRELTLASALARTLRRKLVLPPLLHHFDSVANIVTCSHGDTLSVWRLNASRPPLSSVLDLTALGVPTVPHTALHPPPVCASEGVLVQPCMLVVSPGWVQLGGASRAQPQQHAFSWIHFDSLLFGIVSRGQSRTCSLSQLERVLQPGQCRVAYRRDVMSRALGLLQSRMHGPFAAVHIRALAEAAGKREAGREWTARLARVTASAASQVKAVYVASDSLSSVLPVISRLAVASVRGGGLRVLSARNFSAEELQRVHSDAATANLLLDVTAAVHAAQFSPSPRSGLSLHMTAARECTQSNKCIPSIRGASPYSFSASGCGGEMPGSAALLAPSFGKTMSMRHAQSN